MKPNKMNYGCTKSKNPLSSESFCTFHVLLDTFQIMEELKLLQVSITNKNNFGHNKTLLKQTFIL